MRPELPHRNPVRHRDHGAWLVQFTGRILVVCPRCGGRALVVPLPGLEKREPVSALLFKPRRLACHGCGTLAHWTAQQRGQGLVGAVPGGTQDPFFQQPLWLQTRCTGRILWAYDDNHVDALAAYVGARLRERRASPTRAMFARLPAWMKSARHRDDVLAGLATLRTLAQLSRPSDRSDAAHHHGDRPRHHATLLYRGGPY